MFLVSSGINVKRYIYNVFIGFSAVSEAFEHLDPLEPSKFGLCIYTSTFNFSITQKGFQSIVVKYLLLYFENPFE